MLSVHLEGRVQFAAGGGAVFLGPRGQMLCGCLVFTQQLNMS